MLRGIKGYVAVLSVLIEILATHARTCVVWTVIDGADGNRSVCSRNSCDVLCIVGVRTVDSRTANEESENVIEVGVDVF